MKSAFVENIDLLLKQNSGHIVGWNKPSMKLRSRCRIPMHDTKARAGLSGTWPEVKCRKPDVLDKSAKVFCADFCLLHNIIFSVINPFVGGVGTMNLRTVTVAQHYPFLSSEGCSSDNQISQHPLQLVMCTRFKHSLAFMHRSHESDRWHGYNTYPWDIF